MIKEILDFLSLFRGLFYQYFIDILNTNWSEVQFSHRHLAFIFAAVLLAALFLRLILKLRKKGGFHYHSGYEIDKKDKPGHFIKLIRALPLILVVLSVIPFLVALADPFINVGEKVEVINSRERIDLVDVSGSMSEKIAGRTKSELIRDIHLKFIAARGNIKDRVALFVFASDAELVIDFTTSPISYFFSLASAPIESSYKEGDGTNLHISLDAVIKYFDEKGDKNIKQKSVLIVTDGIWDQDPYPQFLEMRKRNIIPCLIYIGNSDYSSSTAEKLDKLISYVRESGGYAFNILNSDLDSEIRKMNRILDETSAAPITVKRYFKKEFIYQRFLAVGLLLLLSAFVVRFLTILWSRVV